MYAVCADPLRMHAIPEHLSGVMMMRHYLYLIHLLKSKKIWHEHQIIHKLSY